MMLLPDPSWVKRDWLTTPLKAARIYRKVGFRIVPTQPVTASDPKAPLLKTWARAKERLSVRHLHAIYRETPEAGVGLMLGPAGGLIDLDVDNPAAAWPILHRMFPQGLPRTLGFDSNRGFHLLFRYDPAFDEIRPRVLGRAGQIELKFGAVNGRGAAYVIVPPTRLGSGEPRVWYGSGDRIGTLLDLPRSSVNSLIGWMTAEQARRRPVTAAPRVREVVPTPDAGGRPEGIVVRLLGGLDPDVRDRVEPIVREHLPEGYGQRNDCLLGLVRSLKAAFPTADVEDMEPIVRVWHDLAAIRSREQSFAVNWASFESAWKTCVVRDVDSVIRSALEGPAPAWFLDLASHLQCRSDRRQNLECLSIVCQTLHGLNGGTFLLPTGKVSEWIGVDRMTVSRLIRTFRDHGVLRLERRGSWDHERACAGDASFYSLNESEFPDGSRG